MTAASGAAIEIDGVSKWYGSLVAVNEMTFEVFPGVTGVLGPNGAGKTTLLSMMCGLVRPSRGSVRVLGEQVSRNIGLYRRIGVMLDDGALYPFMTGREFVRLSARLQGVTDNEAVENAIRTVNLQDAQDRPTGTYSTGMRQRIRLAAALAHDPDVLLLDEPLNGTDPRQRVEFGVPGEVRQARIAGGECRPRGFRPLRAQQAHRLSRRVAQHGIARQPVRFEPLGDLRLYLLDEQLPCDAGVHARGREPAGPGSHHPACNLAGYRCCHRRQRALVGWSLNTRLRPAGQWQ